MFSLRNSSLEKPLLWMLLLSLPSLFCSIGHAQITLSDSVLHFKAGERPIINVSVKNSAKFALFVATSVEKFEDPSETNAKTVPDDTIVVSPKKFSVPPNGERNVRLVLKKPSGNEEILYTLTFAPQEKEFDEDEGYKANVKGRGISVRVLTGMAALVFVDPARPNPSLKWKREPGRIIFTNDGNQHVRIMFPKACRKDDQGEEECVPIEAKRVYAGKSHEIKLADDATLSFSLKKGASGDFEPTVIPPTGVTSPVSQDS